MSGNRIIDEDFDDLQCNECEKQGCDYDMFSYDDTILCQNCLISQLTSVVSNYLYKNDISINEIDDFGLFLEETFDCHYDDDIVYDVYINCIQESK